MKKKTKDYKTYLKNGCLKNLKGKIKHLYILPDKKSGAMISIAATTESKLDETLYNIVEKNSNIIIVD